MSSFGIVLHAGRAVPLALDAIDWLADRGHEVRLADDEAGLVGRPDLGVPEAKLAAGLDLGGGGTLPAWLLVRDSDAGRRGQLGFRDYYYRDKPYAKLPPGVGLVSLPRLEGDPDGRPTRVAVKFHGAFDPPPAAGERFRLHPRYVDFNSDRVIGHLRAVVVGDVMRRYLTHRGYDVTLIHNFTDVEDKIIAKAAEEGVDFRVVAERNMAAYILLGGPVLLGITYLAYELWGPVGLLLLAAPLAQRPFSRGVDKLTEVYARFLGRVVTRRVVTLAVGVRVALLGGPEGGQVDGRGGRGLVECDRREADAVRGAADRDGGDDLQ